MKQISSLGVQIDDDLSFDRWQLDVVGHLDFGGGGEARTILVAAIADRLDSQSAQLGFQRIGAVLLEQINYLLEQVGQDVVHHRCIHGFPRVVDSARRFQGNESEK